MHFQRHKAKYPHVKMNPNIVPEHLDKFHPPIEPATGSQSPPPPDSPPPPFGGSLGIHSALLAPSLPVMGQFLGQASKPTPSNGSKEKRKRSGQRNSNRETSLSGAGLQLSEQLAVARFLERSAAEKSPSANQPLSLCFSNRSYSPSADVSNLSALSERSRGTSECNDERQEKASKGSVAQHQAKHEALESEDGEADCEATKRQSTFGGESRLKEEPMDLDEHAEEEMSGDESDKEQDGERKGEPEDGEKRRRQRRRQLHEEREAQERKRARVAGQDESSDGGSTSSSLAGDDAEGASNQDEGDGGEGSHAASRYPFLAPNFHPYFHPFPVTMAGLMPPLALQPPTTTSAPTTTGSPTSSPAITHDPAFYQDLLPKPGSTDNTWESLMEIQKASETTKLQQLVDNIEHKMTDPNQCIICHRVLSCKSALQMHYRTHTGERPFKCKICGRAFTTKGNLKTHMGVHRVKPPLRILHQCPVCHKQFTNALVLQQHIRMHTGEPIDISPEHIMANEVRPQMMLPAAFQRPPFSPFGPGSFPPGAPHLPHPGMFNAQLAVSAQAPTGRCSVDTEKDSESGDKPVKSEEELVSPKSNPRSEGKRNAASRADFDYRSGNDSSAPQSPAGSVGSRSRGKSPVGERVKLSPPVTSGASTAAVPNNFSTSLAALENHVKTINSSAPTPMPFGPFGMGLHQFQYQRYVAMAHEQMQQHPSNLKVADAAGIQPTDLSKTVRDKRESKSPAGSLARPFSPGSLTSKGTSLDGGDERSTPGSLPKPIEENSLSNPPSSTGALDLTPKTAIATPKTTPDASPLTPRVAVSHSVSPGIPGAPMFPPPFAGLPFPSARVSTTCQICFKVFACNSALEIHYRSHTKERPFKCEVCDRGFSTKGNMKQHMLTHKIRDLPAGLFTTTSNPPTSTTFTNSNSNGSNSSMSVVSTPVPAMTPSSTNGTPKRERAPVTATTSDTESAKKSAPSSTPPSSKSRSTSSSGFSSKHVCEVCKKPFSSHSALQIHMRTHTGDKPFKCNVCGRAFTTKGNLKVCCVRASVERQRRRSLTELPLPAGAHGNSYVE